MGKFRKKNVQQKTKRKHSGKKDIPNRQKSKDIGVPFKSGQAVAKNDRRKKKRSLTNVPKSLLQNCLKNVQNQSNEELESEIGAYSEVKFNANHVFRGCYKEFKKVIDAADVVLEVLDARDPLGSRCPQLEQAVLSATNKKRLILVLNKIDLIPRDNLEKWIKLFSKELPTVAFKASTQSQKKHLSRANVAAIHINSSLQSTSRCIGANFLMKVLGNYCRNQNILTSIRVGVVGFPNVGKSSIINSLKRSRACVVGSTPGVTRIMQEIILDKHVRLLDSPGVVFAKEGSQSMLALHNALKIETLSDVVTPAEAIVQRVDREQLSSHYNIAGFSSMQELLYLLAQKMGRFKKGGVPDQNAAARKLLNDWNTGTIKYFTHPPEDYQLSVHISAELVQEMSKAFDINSLGEQMELEESLDTETSPDLPSLVSNGIPEIDTGNESQTQNGIQHNSKEEGMLLSSVNVTIDKKKKDHNSNAKDSTEVFLHRLQKNRERKRLFKQLKKKRRRDDKVAAALALDMDNALSLL